MNINEFHQKEIWNDGYAHGLKDSDQIRMRHALEQLLEAVELYRAHDEPAMPIHYVKITAEKGLGIE